MNKTHNQTPVEASTEQSDKKETSPLQVELKKPFVEPVVSVPIDVLEATSFFQSQSSLDASDL